jgi:hypothetical protein
MKTRMFLLSLVSFSMIVFGAALPTLLHAGAETGGGTLWDPFVGSPPFGGTKVTGPLSISYDPVDAPPCGNDLPQANMFYTLRLIKGSEIYTFDGYTAGICLGDVGTPGSGGQGDVLMSFLDTAVKTVFPRAKSWKLKSVDDAGIARDSLAFVADVVIVVKK